MPAGRKAKNSVRLSFLDDDEPPLLYKKVKAVDERRQGLKFEKPAEAPDPEDLPAVVSVHEANRLKKTLAAYRAQLAALLDTYEQRGLHELFGDAAENSRFRLHLHALKHGQPALHERPVWDGVLETLLGDTPNLVKIEQTRPESLKELLDKYKTPVVRTCRLITVPARIRQMFLGETPG